MLALLAAAFLPLAQDLAPPADCPFDRVFELEITADDDAFIKGRGPTQFVEYDVQFDGTLHIWTKSELKLYLAAELLPDEVMLRDTGDADAGRPPYLEVTVEDGQSVAILVASSSVEELGEVVLHLAALPETSVTRAAARAADVARTEVERLRSEGELTQARALIARTLEPLHAAPGAELSELVSTVSRRLGESAHGLDDSDIALRAWSWTYRHRSRTRPPDDSITRNLRQNLGQMLNARRNYAGARELFEAALPRYERTLPEDHPNLIMARSTLGLSLFYLGDHADGLALQEAALAGLERTRPQGHRPVLDAKANLATCLVIMGDFTRAGALQEVVLLGLAGVLPDDHPRLLAAKSSLAVSKLETGDLAGAHALLVAVLAGYERTLPDDHLQVLRAKEDLVMSLRYLGDLAGARALQEAVLAGKERTLPEDHRDLLVTKGNLANLLAYMGDHAGALALLDAVITTWERTGPEDDLGLFVLKESQSSWLSIMGHPAEARTLLEATLERYEPTLSRDHPDILRAKTNLATHMATMGDFAGAIALQEAVLAGYERTQLEDHPILLQINANLATSRELMGDHAGARAIVPGLADRMLARVVASLAFAPRQALGAVDAESGRLSTVVFLTESAEAGPRRIAFELTETLRLVAGEAARSLARHEADPELAPILTEAASVRRSLNDLVAGPSREATDDEALAQELTRLTLARDRLEGEASRLLAARGVVAHAVETDALAAALGPREVAVGFRRLEHWNGMESGSDRVIAHLLTSAGALTRVDLGSAVELEELAGTWRTALGAPLMRGIALTGAEDSELVAGRALRERLLDPVLVAAGEEVARLFVCADDLLFLVPLDALPLAEEGEAERLGELVQIVNEVSFARLLSPAPASAAAPSLLALGGVDYDAQGSTPAGVTAASAPIEMAAAGETERPAGGETSAGSALPERFEKLLQSRYEAEATGGLFEEAFEVEPVLLTRKQTTKAALFEASPGTRYLHVATHGWFAPESIRSVADASPTDSVRMSLEERITGLAPMTLCGLALAGANRGRDSLGRVPGILTAEELCSLDLAQCELAVLSACETNVGIHRAGQGIQSLQAALYAAGARTSITSLWKVDDAATRRLFEVFYTNLWDRKLPKAEALWQAKLALREEGHPPRDWAGWVLSGDPD